MSEVKRRVDPDANPRVMRSEQTLEYDGADAPVLIRLPEMATDSGNIAASPTPNGPEKPPAARPPAEQRRSEGKSRRSRRRIDRSHLPQAPKMPVPEGVPFDLRSKSFIAAVVLAAVGLMYVFLSGDSKEAEPASDAWATSTESGALDDPQIRVEVPDLWPANATPVDPQMSSSLPSARQPTSLPVGGPPAADVPNQPVLSGPTAPWKPAEAETTWPISGSVPEGSAWPAAPQQQGEVNRTAPGGPTTHQVSWPDQKDGASVSKPNTYLASIAGIRIQSTIDRNLDLDTTQSPPQRRNHERLRNILSN